MKKTKRNMDQSINDYAGQLEEYLNMAHKFTDDFQEVLDFGLHPSFIVAIKNDKQRGIAAMIYVLSSMLATVEHDVVYDTVNCKFTVTIKKY